MDYQRLIIRHLSGETHPEEEQLLHAWLEQSDTHRQEYDSLAQVWKLTSEEKSPPNPENVYARIDAQIEKEKSFSIGRQPYTAVAAVITLLLVASTLVWNYRQLTHENQLWQEVQTLKGEQRQLQLSDGTLIYLNTESSIQYPEVFEGNERRVILDGEAFFDVARDTLKPFIISLPEGGIQVLGTSFNVKAYADDSKIETTVSSGKVAFLKPDENSLSTFIQPNEKLSYTKKDKSITKEQTEVEHSLAWMNNKIVFQAQSLEEIAEALEHYFEIEIYFQNEQLRNCTLTGSFHKDSYQDILNTLAMTNTFTYKAEGKRITLYGKGCQNTE